MTSSARKHASPRPVASAPNKHLGDSAADPDRRGAKAAKSRPSIELRTVVADVLWALAPLARAAPAEVTTTKTADDAVAVAVAAVVTDPKMYQKLRKLASAAADFAEALQQQALSARIAGALDNILTLPEFRSKVVKIAPDILVPRIIQAAREAGVDMSTSAAAAVVAAATVVKRRAPGAQAARVLNREERIASALCRELDSQHSATSVLQIRSMMTTGRRRHGGHLRTAPVADAFRYLDVRRHDHKDAVVLALKAVFAEFGSFTESEFNAAFEGARTGLGLRK